MGGGGFLNDIRSIHFPSRWIGYSVGENNVIYKSTNGGNIWYNQIQLGLGAFNSVFFINDTIGIAVGDGGLMYRTMNGGTVGINIISSEIPNSFNLRQNYTNTFNLKTTIEFEISKRSLIK